jgi:hypothetical protein
MSATEAPSLLRARCSDLQNLRRGWPRRLRVLAYSRCIPFYERPGPGWRSSAREIVSHPMVEALVSARHDPAIYVPDCTGHPAGLVVSRLVHLVLDGVYTARCEIAGRCSSRRLACIAESPAGARLEITSQMRPRPPKPPTTVGLLQRIGEVQGFVVGAPRPDDRDGPIQNGKVSKYSEHRGCIRKIKKTDWVASRRSRHQASPRRQVPKHQHHIDRRSIRLRQGEAMAAPG